MEDGIEQFMIRTIADMKPYLIQNTELPTVIPREVLTETQPSKLPTIQKTALKIKKD